MCCSVECVHGMKLDTSGERQRCSSLGALPKSCVYGLVGEIRLPPNSLKGSALLLKSPIPSVTLLQPPGPSCSPDDSEPTSKET